MCFLVTYYNTLSKKWMYTYSIEDISSILFEVFLDRKINTVKRLLGCKVLWLKMKYK